MLGPSRCRGSELIAPRRWDSSNSFSFPRVSQLAGQFRPIRWFTLAAGRRALESGTSKINLRQAAHRRCGPSPASTSASLDGNLIEIGSYPTPPGSMT